MAKKTAKAAAKPKAGKPGRKKPAKKSDSGTERPVRPYLTTAAGTELEPMAQLYDAMSEIGLVTRLPADKLIEYEGYTDTLERLFRQLRSAIRNGGAALLDRMESSTSTRASTEILSRAHAVERFCSHMRKVRAESQPVDPDVLKDMQEAGSWLFRRTDMLIAALDAQNVSAEEHAADWRFQHRAPRLGTIRDAMRDRATSLESLHSRTPDWPKGARTIIEGIEAYCARLACYAGALMGAGPLHELTTPCVPEFQDGQHPGEHEALWALSWTMMLELASRQHPELVGVNPGNHKWEKADAPAPLGKGGKPTKGKAGGFMRRGARPADGDAVGWEKIADEDAVAAREIARMIDIALGVEAKGDETVVSGLPRSLSTAEQKLYDGLRGKCMNTSAIIDAGLAGDENVARNRISAIRNKLGRDAIRNTRGNGYWRPDHLPPDRSA